MKSLWSKLLFLAMLCIIPVQMAAADTTIAGSQTAGSPGSNAKLSCTPVKISKPMTISAVSGSNAGFWIQSGPNIVARFNNENDASAVGKTLPAGTYTVYPNLPHGGKSATVKITLK